LFATLAVLADASLVSGQSSNRRNALWSAEWITAPDTHQRDEVVLHFRKVIELSQPPQQFLVNVSADNQFVFYVNQQRVGSGPSRSDLEHWRYETFDIAPLLHAGRNVLAATAWNFGTHAAIAQISDRVGFILHGEGEAARIADTDASWEVEQEKAIQTLRPDTHNYMLPNQVNASMLLGFIGNGTAIPAPLALGRRPLRLAGDRGEKRLMLQTIGSWSPILSRLWR
jgi:hypothetical protein